MAAADPMSASSTLASHLRILRRRGWVLVLCLILVPAATIFFSERGATLYQASSEIYANGDNFGSLLTGIEMTPTSANTAENVVYLAQTPRVARRTLRAEGRTDRSPNYLLAHTTVLAEGVERLLRHLGDGQRPDRRRSARHRICAPGDQVQERAGNDRRRERPKTGLPQARCSCLPVARRTPSCTAS